MLRLAKFLILIYCFVISALLCAYTSDVELTPKSKENLSHIEFSPNEAEKKYLSTVESIPICVDPDWLPYEEIDDEGRYVGLVAEYMGLISEIIGKEFRIVSTKTWSESLKYAKDRKCDILPGAVSTLERRKYLSFSKPYVFIPLVVVTDVGKPFIADLTTLFGKRIAIIDGYAAAELLKRKHPDIVIVNVDDAITGLKMVQDGDVYGYIDTLPTINYQIWQSEIDDLKVSGQVDFKYDVSVAVRNDRPQLLSIINKAISAIPHEEHQKLFYKWISVKYEKGFDHALFWKMVTTLLLVILFIIYWNCRLKRAKKEVEIALKAERLAIQQNLNFIDMISHEYRTPLSVINSCLDIIELKYATKLCPELEEQANGIREASQRLVNIFDSSLGKDKTRSAISANKSAVEVSSAINLALSFVRCAYPTHNFVYEGELTSDITVWADKELFVTAVSNLLDNAGKYSAENSTCTIKTEIKGDNCIISVKDRGKGIRSDELDDIFTKYYRSQHVGDTRGAGIGLFLVKKIVDIHGGDISVSSTFGEGTEVTLTFSLNRRDK